VIRDISMSYTRHAVLNLKTIVWMEFGGRKGMLKSSGTLRSLQETLGGTHSVHSLFLEKQTQQRLIKLEILLI
jgi:hypothetical protein